VAVQAFLSGSIGFTDIYRLVDRVLSEHNPQPSPNLDAILDADRWANRRAAEIASSGVN
jgi:1-deoxy-D-xylulose-5-phosphate reductoisomerase